MTSLKEKYLDILTSGASLTALCEVLSEAIGNPVALTLQTRTIIAHSRSYTKELIEEYTTTNSLLTEEEQQEHYNLINSRLHSRRPFIGLYPYLRHKHMNCGCFWKGSLLAVIDVPIVNKVIINDTLLLLEEAEHVFTSALALNGGIPSGLVDPMETYLIGLLRGDIQPEYQQEFHYNIPFRSIAEWRAVWIAPDEPSMLSDITGQIYSFCSNQRSVWCTRWTNGMVLLMDAQKTDCLETLRSKLPSITMAVSDPFRELTATAAQVQNARTALRLANFEDCRERLVFVKKYKTPLFFLSHAQSCRPEEYKSFLLADIRQYDQEHNSDYFPTLRAYLLDNMDLNQMASDLNVHRNTVAYRLQRIQDLFAVNLSDCRIITELYLALFEDLLTQAITYDTAPQQ